MLLLWFCHKRCSRNDKRCRSWLGCFFSQHYIWACARQNQKNDMCTKRRLRSAWASAQSDQSSLSAWRKVGSIAIFWVHSEDSDQTGRMPRLIIRLGRCPGWSESSLGTRHFVGFIIRWLIYQKSNNRKQIISLFIAKPWKVQKMPGRPATIL